MCSNDNTDTKKSSMINSKGICSSKSSDNISGGANDSKTNELRYKFLVTNEGYIFKEKTPEKQPFKGIYISPSSTSKSSDTPSMVESLLDHDEEDEENNMYETTMNNFQTDRDLTNLHTNDFVSPKKRLVTPEKVGATRSASCLVSCLFRDTWSDLTKIISSTQNVVNKDSPTPDTHAKHTKIKENSKRNPARNISNNEYKDWTHLCGATCDGEHIAPSPQKKSQRVFIRNRATNTESRKTRIRRLRRELAPFENYESQKIDKTNSFQIKKSSDFVRPRTQSSTGLSQSISSMTSVIESVRVCGTLDVKDTKVNPETFDDDDLCYDSDPGDIEVYRKRCTEGSCQKQSYLRHSGKWNGADLNQSDFFFTSFHDDMLTLRETMNTTLILIWHRTPSIINKDSSPIAVHAWVEYGMQLRATLVQPKFMWKPINDSKIKGQDKVRFDHSSIHAIDLLDMIRILDIDKVNRDKYPLANNPRSFMIEAYDENFLFECKCNESRDRLVYGLKLAVARLGSRIMVGDKGVFSEFFDVPHSSDSEDMDEVSPENII